LGLLLGVGIGLFVGFMWFFGHIIADGSYTISVTVVSKSGTPIARLRCDAASYREEVIRQLEQKELAHFEDSSHPFATFTGLPVSVRGLFSTHYNGFWIERRHSQSRHLIIEVEYQDGTRSLKITELPDSAKVKSVTVTVP